ncbi:hypothetical protein SPI_02002 [Niveomyces insectorum RCEF 264]|uniref:Trafficking protein particle complex subunit 11 domain-containing protein n=1 Tax=Niveomyces insectorum RCEF 264 TaxID=1081102 RepID=A0A167XP39_9HYPO|nr:hypothetical protein SPI_02002 [Niveomyces insectorum RCEF 264]
MDDYPAYSLNQNVPLLITIGLPSVVTDGGDNDGGGGKEDDWTADLELKEQATLLHSDLPVLDGDHAAEFSRYITAGNVSGGPVPTGTSAWRGRVSSQRYKFRIRTAGRTYYLPPRRARLPEAFDVPENPPPVLHSPFSPLSPFCSLYPDGIIDAQWIRKHQETVPSVFVCFYALTSDANTATLQDNKIKSDIQAFRAAVQQSGYKSRLAVAIFADEGATTDGGASGGAVVQERLETIRRGSGVESKLFFAVASDASADELHRVAENMLTTIHAAALDYYRDLGRHARKKRGRGSAPQPSVPPTSGTSQTLSLAGWHIRYDVKAAVFAEFRQETGAALRLFEQAYEALLGPDVFESIPHWSPRWNEARLLADTLAVRSLRCLLLGGQYSGAVRRWSAHRDRLRVLLETRGRGTANYGWQAWEARWAVIMATLVRRVVANRALAYDAFLCPPPHKEYPLTGHGPGVDHSALIVGYLETARDEFRKRRQTRLAAELALECGREHAAAQRWQAALDVLAPLWAAARYKAEGWFNIHEELAWTLRTAAAATLTTNNTAAAATAAPAGERRADLLVAIDWELLDSRYTPRPHWHYDVSKALATRNESRDGGNTEEDDATNEEEDADTKVVAVQFAKDSLPPSFLSPAFVFQTGEGKAGETAQAQLVLRSNAFAHALPVIFEELRVRFDGSIKPIVLRHDDGNAEYAPASQTVPKVAHRVVHLEEDEEEDENGEKTLPGEGVLALRGTTNLTLRPQSSLVLEVAIPLREAGDARAVAAELAYRCAQYTLALTVPLRSDAGGGTSVAWYRPHAGARGAVPRPDGQAIRILPRPPKLAIQFVQQDAVASAATAEATDGTMALPPLDTSTAPATPTLQYYTNETVDLAFALVNAEDADASVKLDVVFQGDDDAAPGFTLFVAGDEIDTAPPADPDQLDDPASATTALRSVPLGTVATARALAVSVRLAPVTRSAQFVLTLRAVYHLRHDPATPITQMRSWPLSLSNPFEANYDLLPRLHADPWPSVFDHQTVVPAEGADGGGVANEKTGEGGGGGDGDSGARVQPRGLSQAWALVTRYASFAAEDLRVVDLDIVVQPVPGVVCRHTRRLPPPPLSTSSKPDGGGLLCIQPQTMEEAQFDLVVQKARLDHREPVQLDVVFVIRWQRLAAAGHATEQEKPVPPPPPPPPPCVNTTTLPVPRLSVFGTEPRVLAAVSYARPEPDNNSRTAGTTAGSPGTVIRLDLVIENPSHHFLTFGLSMEPSADFAFAGAKLTTVHVLPVSRRTAATYRLLPLVQGAWIKPALVVRDKYFQKVLRILPTEGMKLDKDGILIWVPPDEEEEEEEETEEKTTEATGGQLAEKNEAGA